jgi:hypothetical protein
MKDRPVRLLALALLPLALAACVSLPSGPGVTALPGSRMSFEQFRFDDATCRDYASGQVGGQQAAQRANDSAVASAIVGTAIGAAAGAALGDTSHAAGVGAGMGLLTGAMIGSANAQTSYYGSQRRYDSAYLQCMYAKGHKVPVSGRLAQSYSPAPDTYAAPRGYAPPPDAAIPPPNTPPPTR